MAILPVGLSAEEGGYQIERSLRFNSADSAYLNRTPASAGNRKTWTWSGWVKRSRLGTEESLFSCGTTTSDTAFGQIIFSSDDKLRFNRYYDTLRGTNAVYRDLSAWYHIVVVLDTPNATAADRAILYVNNEKITSFEYSNNPTQNIDLAINQNIQHTIGRFDVGGGGNYLSSYMTEVHFIDGQALTPTDFGEYNTDTGVWQPKAYEGSYGTNGFYLNFSDNSGTTSTTLGKDYSGNGNNWTPNNFSVTAGAGNDSLVDSPTRYGTDTGVGGEVRGNYATLNPLINRDGKTLQNGNLYFTNSGSGKCGFTSTAAMSSGKWYWEVTSPNLSNSGGIGVGIYPASKNIYISVNGDIGEDGGIEVRCSTTNSNYLINSTSDNTGFNVQFADDTSIGLAVDIDNGTMDWYSGGVLAKSVTGLSLSGSSWVFAVANETAVSARSADVNFGQRPFAYTAPSGFKALCTTNLPEPAIADGGDYFNAVLYTGTSPSTNSVTGVGFQPDLVWVKSRTSSTRWHENYDVLRPDKKLSTNATDPEYTETMTFDSDGFTTSGGVGPNESGNSYVGWAWKANGAGVSNTDGTISSTVSANTTAGFSIVTYTGTGSNATVGHGLGVAPAMIIVKNRSSATDWAVYHKSLTSAAYWLELNSTGAQSGPNSVVFNSTAPTSTVFSVGTNDRTNTNNHVAYCFAEVPGFSAAFSYVGTGNADGPFVHLGFRARYFILKNRTNSQSWSVQDTARSSYNVGSAVLLPNSSGAEATGTDLIDVLSNGFKIRHSSSGNNNNSGDTYVGFAFAENPFKFSLAR